MGFTSFGKKISDIAGSTSKKSSALLEQARLNAEINRLIADVEDLQFELGRAYYEDNKSKSIGPYKDILEKIHILQLEIRSKDEKLLAQKGLLYCSGCDAVVSREDEFCSKCGLAVPRGKEEKPVYECRNCGEFFVLKEECCPKCGVRAKQ